LDEGDGAEGTNPVAIATSGNITLIQLRLGGKPPSLRILLPSREKGVAEMAELVF
jgi:hypothetical protein